jgi:MoaD family protein
MHVNLYASFRERAGTNGIEMQVSQNDTVRSMIKKITSNYPELKEAWLDEFDELFAHVHVSLNQVDVMILPDQLDTIVCDSDVMDFFPPIHGG